MWLAVASREAQGAARFLQEAWFADASEAERAAAAAVVNHDAAVVVCPACQHRFPSGPSECPDCGLGLR